MGKQPTLRRRLTLFCVFGVGILTLTILFFSGFQVKRVEQRQQSRFDPNHSDAEYYPFLNASESSASSPMRAAQLLANIHTPTEPSFANKHLLAAWKERPADPRKRHFPPLREILSNRTIARHDESNIVGDVSFLLDIAILGHAKTATSFLMKWLRGHPGVQMWDDEVCDLYSYRPALLAQKLYTDFPASNATTHRGFKCPGHFSHSYLRYFTRYFTRARLVVGLRHPVLWFQSYYNFLTRKNLTLPDPATLVGPCTVESRGVCTDRANFHSNLAKLGKTNLSDPSEQHLLRLPSRYQNSVRLIDNPVFLYDLAQIYDPIASRVEQFKVDLQHFLMLDTPLPDTTNASKKTTSSRPKRAVFNVCEPQYQALRAELVKVGKRASLWIRRYLLRSEQVFVSDQEHFEQILRQWQFDPCENSTAPDPPQGTAAPAAEIDTSAAKSAMEGGASAAAVA